MKSKSFIPAAKDAVSLILSNGGRIAIVNAFSFVFEYLGNLCISLITAAICYLILVSMDRYKNLENPLPTTIVNYNILKGVLHNCLYNCKFFHGII